MVRLISRQRGGLAALKLTKLFGIDDFPAAKDSGKVLIIIIYCYLIIIIIIITIINIIVIILILILILILIIIIIIIAEAYHQEAINSGSMLPIFPKQSNLTS